jgi:hypothetical protein
MGTNGQTQNTGGDGRDNVIRFPRDWFGSKDDLIPIGSAADRLDAEAARAAVPAREETSALNADDFWGEGAEALHQPVGIPEREDPIRHAFGQPDGTYALTTTSADATAKLRQRISAQRLGLTVGSLRRVAAVGVLLAAAAMAIFILTTGRSSHSQPAARKLTDDQQPAAFAVAGTESLSSRQISAAEQLIHQRMAPVTKTRARQPLKHANQHRESTVRRTANSPTRRNAVRAGATAVASGTPASDETASSSVIDRSAAASEPAHAASASTSGASGAGPGGLGSAVGPNCTPVCSGN